MFFIPFWEGINDDVIKWKHFARYCMAFCGENPPVIGGFPTTACDCANNRYVGDLDAISPIMTSL